MSQGAATPRLDTARNRQRLREARQGGSGDDGSGSGCRNHRVLSAEQPRTPTEEHEYGKGWARLTACGSRGKARRWLGRQDVPPSGAHGHDANDRGGMLSAILSSQPLPMSAAIIGGRGRLAACAARASAAKKMEEEVTITAMGDSSGWRPRTCSQAPVWCCWQSPPYAPHDRSYRATGFRHQAQHHTSWMGDYWPSAHATRALGHWYAVAERCNAGLGAA